MQCVRKTNLNRSTADLRKSPHNRDNLSDDFRILVNSVLRAAMEIARVRMDNERVVFDPTACRQISPITLENNIDRLLPKGSRRKVKGCFSPAVDHDK
jgi:hypothetical protein